MPSSDLQLERFRLQRLEIEFNEAFLSAESGDEEQEETYRADTDFEWWEPERGGDCMTMLRVDCYPQSERPTPRFLHVGVALWGVFSCSPDLEEHQKDRLLRFNTVAILHGIARGVIAGATGSCPGGPFLLPVVNYAEVIERKTAQRESEAETEDAEPVEGLGDE
jgi:preprotein translocase subunit SecB